MRETILKLGLLVAVIWLLLWIESDPVVEPVGECLVVPTHICTANECFGLPIRAVSVSPGRIPSLTLEDRDETNHTVYGTRDVKCIAEYLRLTNQSKTSLA